MKMSICLVASLLLVFVGASMANDEMMEDNELANHLVKRSVVPPPCGDDGARCKNSPCCPGSTCVYGSCKSCNPRKCKKARDCCDQSSCVYGNCKSCNPRKCKKTRDCCDQSSCVYGNCKSCTPRTCKNTRDCCADSSCVYGNCKSCRGLTCKGKKDCCRGYTCSSKNALRRIKSVPGKRIGKFEVIDCDNILVSITYKIKFR